MSLKCNGKEVEVLEFPDCDVCKQKGKKKQAVYDAKTCFGSWAYLCEKHYKQFGIGLGVGRGQKLIIKQKEK